MRIRKAQLDQLSAQASREKRAALARELGADDPSAKVEPDAGRVTFQDARGHSSTVELSDQGLASIRTAEGREYRIERDSEGLVTTFEANGHSRYDIAYQDEAPVLIARAGTALVRLGYSIEKGTVSARFPDDSLEKLEFDASGQQLRSATDALGHTTTFVRNQAGHVVEVRDARGFSTRFELDEDGEPLSTDFPDGTTETYTDTEAGLEIRHSDGTVTAVEANDADESKTVRFDDGSSVRLKLVAGNVVELGNGVHEFKCSYGGDGLLSREERDDRAVDYSFDKDGNLEELSDGTQSFRFKYDGDDLLTSVTAWDQGQIELRYARSGQISGIRFPNGVVTSVNASADGQVQGIVTANNSATRGRSIVDDRYSYDSRDRVKSRNRLGRVADFDYDAGGRLIAVRARNEQGADDEVERFSYDETGNLTSVLGRRATFDAMNRIQQLGDIGFEHDAAGNVIRRTDAAGDRTYRYNGQGLLVEATNPNDSVRFTYDGFGRRITKTRDTETTEYVWAGRQLLSEECSLNGAVVERREYLYYPGQFLPLAVRINGEAFYYHTDRAGTVLALTDGGGAIVWQAEYSAFGASHIVVERISQPLRQLGQYHDRETGLYYNLFRYYDSTLGRYISPDPIRYASGSTNFYVYANNDPINRSDPEGHIVIPAALLVIAGAAIVGGLIGGAISAASGDGFWKGAAAGAVAGAIGAAAPILAMAAGLGGAALVAAALAGDAIAGGVQACMEGDASLGSFASGAGIALATTVLTLGLAKIPGIRRALQFVGKKLTRISNRALGKANRALSKIVRRPPRTMPVRGVTNKEIELSASSEVSQAARDARKKVASAFYEEHTTWPKRKISSHVKGVDLDKPVIPRRSPPPRRATSWQTNGQGQGNYYAKDGTPPTELGISALGRNPQSGQVEFKQPAKYRIEKNTPILESTAAPIKDTWSVGPRTGARQGNLGDLPVPHDAKGGATQYFVPDTQAAIPK